MREYVWTRCKIKEEDQPPGEGWEYYGGCIRGTREEPTASVWRLTRWAKVEGETQRFEVQEKLSVSAPNAKVILPLSPKPLGKTGALDLLKRQIVTPVVTVTPPVTPQEPLTKPKGLAWALQLLRT